MSQAADEGKSSASAENEGATSQFEKTLKHDVSALKKEYLRLVVIEEIPAEKLPEDIKKQSFSQKVGTLAEGVGSVCFSLVFTGEPHMKLYVLADTRGYTILNPEAAVAASPPEGEERISSCASISSPFEAFEQLLTGIRPHAFEVFQMEQVNARLEEQLQKQ